MDFEQVCRTCLQSGGDLRSIFDSKLLELEHFAIIDLLKIITEALISHGDGYPDQICAECLSEIQQIYSFKMKCEKSDAILRQFKNFTIVNHIGNRPMKIENDSKLNDAYDNTKEPKIRMDECNKSESNAVQIAKAEINADLEEKSDTKSENDFQEEESRTETTFALNNVESILGDEETQVKLELEKEIADDGNEQTKGEFRIKFIKEEPELDISGDEGNQSDLDETESESFHCSNCSYECLNIEGLEQHIIDVHFDGQMCKLCNKEFSGNLIEHCVQHIPEHHFTNTRNTTYNCDICETSFQYKYILTTHIREKHPDKYPEYIEKNSYKCKKCSKSFRTRTKLVEHLRVHTGEKPFKCEVCSKSYVSKSTLKSHAKAVHGIYMEFKRRQKDVSLDVPMKCEKCDKTYRNAKALRLHTKVQHPSESVGKPALRCEICSKMFLSKFNLDEHVRIHTKEKPLQCQFCPKAYRYKSALTSHTQVNHPNEISNKPDFQCKICSKISGSRTQLLRHMQIHTGDKPFKCEICSKSFRFNNCLSAHIRSKHTVADTTKVNKYQCEICSKVFTTKLCLAEHSHKHSGEKPFVCAVCFQSYAFSGSLRMHMRVKHFDVAKNAGFGCDVCSERCATKAELREHVKCHKVEKPISCEHCSEVYPHKSHLMAHMEVSHPTKCTYKRKFQCGICSKRLDRRTELNEHMRLHTGERSNKCHICSKDFRWKNNFVLHMALKHSINVNDLPEESTENASRNSH